MGTSELIFIYYRNDECFAKFLSAVQFRGYSQQIFFTRFDSMKFNTHEFNPLKAVSFLSLPSRHILQKISFFYFYIFK